MRRAAVVGIAGLAMLVTASGAAGSGNGPLLTLVDAERAFARRATESSTRTAFTENLGKDAIVFRPGAINHHFFAESNPDWGTKGLLTWDPAFGRTSMSGDFGYTTGPAEYRATRDPKSEPIWWGYFVSVWTREGGGTWRVALDTGTSTPKPAYPIARFEPGATMERVPAAARADSRAGLANLKLAETAFSQLATQKGVAAAYRELLAETGRVHRDEHAPAVGLEAGLAVLDAQRKETTWAVMEARVASSADLGFSYGSGEARRVDGSVAKFAFVRIWEIDGKGKWRIVLDVETPMPVQP